MTSTFNLLTAGGARFDKNRFKNDIELFTPKAPKAGKSGKAKPAVSRKGKEKANEDDASDDDDEDSDESSDEEETRPAPPKQKITLSGSDPLPRSLHANLPSLITHPSHPSSSHAGQPLLDALRASNIHSLWGVQCAVGGCLLDDRDVMCIAPTGSGKTLSYLLPTLVRLGDSAREIRAAADKSEEGEVAAWKGIRSVVLVPTHDLAMQIHGVFKAVSAGRKWRGLVLSKATEHAVCESAPGRKFTGAKRSKKNGSESDEDEDGDSEDEDEDEMDSDAESTGSVNEFANGNESGDDAGEAPSTDALGIDCLIATPERLHHLLEQKLVSLAGTRHLILDEADRLLSSDFKPQVLPILKAASHPAVQKCFLSATMPSSSEQIAKAWLRDGGIRVVVGLKDSAVTTVSQSLLYTGSESGKLMALRNLIASGDLPYPSLIFVQSVARAEELHSTLILDGLRVDSVHGNRTPAQRDAAIKAFREGTAFVLVVTEVLARGMDFRGVKVVINYDFPQTVQSYIHRIGRTGRAGRPGKAITFFGNEDAPHLRTIANVLRASGCFVPEYMLEMKKPSKNLKKFRAQVPVKRKEIGGGGRDVGRERSRKKRDMILASKRRKEKADGAGKEEGEKAV